MSPPIIYPWRSSEIFVWNIRYFGFVSWKLGILDYFLRRLLLFSNNSGCFRKWAKPVLLLWEKDLVTKKRFMQNYLIYLWHAPKRHTNYKIWGKSQFGFLKIVKIKAKSDERQGKTWNIFEKMCVFSPLLISWLYSLNSWRNFTFHRAMPYIWHGCEPTTFLCFNLLCVWVA